MHADSHPDENRSLAEHAAELRSRVEAASRFQGGYTYYVERLGIFRDYLKERPELILSEEKLFADLASAPDDEGNEHQVWLIDGATCYLKVTWPDFFGLSVVYRSEDEQKASPIDYLERWHWHNQLFGDGVIFHGVLISNDQLRLVISQPALIGSPATAEETKAFFTAQNWLPFEEAGEIAFFEPREGIVVSDTHPGNIVKTVDGHLLPIDLRVQKLTGTLLSTLQDRTNSASD